MPTSPKPFRPQRGQSSPDAQRGSARGRGYDAAWDRASKAHLREHPLCVYCETGAFGQLARPVVATLVDHLYPQRRHPELFWERRFWVSSCSTCHNGPKQRLEAGPPAHLDQLARRIGYPTRDQGG